jgi:hypothetical protein
VIQSHLDMQQDFVKRFYSWGKKGMEWTSFLQGILDAKSK